MKSVADRSSFGWLIPVVITILLVPVSRIEAQEQNDSDLPEAFRATFPLYSEALGPFTRAISTPDVNAQDYFNQGFQMMYAFAKMEAARSFREAWKLDPNCAICYWGEAWAWGSYLNGQIREEDAPHAYAAIQKAMALASDHATPSEQAFINAMSVRYIEDYVPDNRVEQDEAYAEAMRLVSERYPDDLDAMTLYADALFLLEPRRGTRDLNDPRVQRLHSVLESVLARDIKHPFACHLYIHATESTTAPEKAADCAEYLGFAIPGASHINHMPSHTWNEIGRWADGVRSNLMAWHSDQRAEIGKGFAIYPSHNLHMLLFAASMDGQGAIAIQAGKDYAKVTRDGLYHALTLLRFGRFDEILKLTDGRSESNEVSAGLWDFAQGYAHLRTGERDFAEVYLQRVLDAAETSEDELRRHPASHLLGIVGAILSGELHRNIGDNDSAIVSFQEAVTLEDELVYDEPEPLPFAARHWLGAVLIEAERYEEAEQVYRDELADHQHNGWSLFGLRTALEAQGKSLTDIEKELEASWARSDIWLQTSRF
jgi:tetratricopeptide (TPR) repeat protein